MLFKLKSNIFKSLDFYLDQINNTNKKCINRCSISPPSEIKFKPGQKTRVIVIGDIHGDLNALLYALYKSKVIDTKGNWTGGNSIVVQLGDQIDKGGRGNYSVDFTQDPLEELRIIEFMHNLHNLARKVNGAVYNLIGNHELMNVLGDFRYATESHINGFGGNKLRKLLFQPGGPIAKKLACNTNGAMRIGNWLFVHAGLLPEHVENFTIKEINKIVRNILLGNTNLRNINSKVESLIFGAGGILWNRAYSTHQNQNCDMLEKTLNILKIGKKGGMVVGHTPKNRITASCNNRIWMADVGMSTAFGGDGSQSKVEILEIINDGEKINVI